MNSKRVPKILWGAVFVLMAFIQTPRVYALTNYLLWDSAPATDWMSQAYPVGNGKTGGMIFGNPATEHVTYNDITLWQGAGQGKDNFGNYVGFGEIFISVSGVGSYTNYRRQLDIGEAIQTTTYTANSKNYAREWFCSFPDSVLVGHFTTNTAAGLSLDVSVTGCAGLTSNSVSASGSTITQSGYCGEPGLANENFEAQVFVKNYGGTKSVNGAHIVVTNADSVDIICATGTDWLQSYAAGWRGTAPHNAVTSKINNAAAKAYSDLKSSHLADYQAIFNKFYLDLNDSINKGTPTPARRNSYTRASGNDRGLEVLFTQMGRYLLIECSRNCLPANLQGLWNSLINPAWNCSYHPDVNIEMAYYGVESLNMMECFNPLFNYINSVRVPCHNNFPQFRGWGPSDNHQGAMASAWFSNNAPANGWELRNLWDHYEFSPDTAYLHKLYPMLKEESQFWQDNMFLHNGKLESQYDVSPENSTNYGGFGAAYDQQFATDVLTNYSKAEDVLNLDPTYHHQVDSMLAITDNGIRIGSWGQIEEWCGDYDSKTDHNGHCAHLVCVHPCGQVSPLINTTNANAATVSITARGDSGGWCAAMRSLIWARLLNSDQAYSMFSNIIYGSTFGNLFDIGGGVFQIDGNEGGAAAVAEMIAQSHANYKIHLLPALPSKWPKGTVKGLRLRNGFVITTMSWSGGALSEAYINSTLGKQCVIYGTNYCIADSATGSYISTTTNSGCLQFNTTLGKTFKVTPSTGVCVTSVGEMGPFKSRSHAEFSVELYDLRGRLIYRTTGIKSLDALHNLRRSVAPGIYLQRIKGRDAASSILSRVAVGKTVP